MGEEQGLSAENRALVFALHLPSATFRPGMCAMDFADLNRLLDAARSEGATFSGGVSLSSVPRSEGLQPVSVKGEELRRVLDGLGYQAVFNAIGAAVEWRTGRVLGISVERFIFSLTGVKRQDEIVDIDAEDARAMSPEALETAAEGTGK